VKLLSITFDAGNLKRTHNSFSPIFPEMPYPTPDDVKTLLDDSAGKTPRAGEVNPKKFFAGSFVDEMERSGFIEQLYIKIAFTIQVTKAKVEHRCREPRSPSIRI
jgi:hypothetical protein